MSMTVSKWEMTALSTHWEVKRGGVAGDRKEKIRIIGSGFFAYLQPMHFIGHMLQIL